MELQLAIAQAQREAAASQAETAIFKNGCSQLASFSVPLTQIYRCGGKRPDVKVIERPVPVETTVLVNEDNNKVLARYDGVRMYGLAQRYGFGKGQRANNACRQWLLSIGVTEEQWVEEPTAHTTRKLPRQLLAMLDRQFGSKQGSRQRLLGEGAGGGFFFPAASPFPTPKSLITESTHPSCKALSLHPLVVSEKPDITKLIEIKARTVYASYSGLRSDEVQRQHDNVI